jgi:hypothetical protein
MAAKDGIRVHVYGDYDDKDIKKAIKGLESLKKEGDKSQTAFGKISQSMKGFGLSAVGATLGVVGIGAALVSFTKGAEDAEIANRKLFSVLDSMGYGEAADRVSAYAETLERTVAVDADVIKATQTKLATFANLTKTINDVGGAFDRATVATLDLAAAGFGTAETNAVQLGKALQDPIKGITALARAGVTFTEQEKDKIRALVESNQSLEAQDLILQAIEKQVGGTAEAGASSFDRIRLSAMQVADVIGLALLPFVEAFADFLSNTLVPAITGMTSGIGNATRVINENKAAFILVTVAVGTLTAALVVQRTALTASSIAFAVNVAASKLLVGAINVTTTAIVAMSAAMRLIPFVAIATAAAAFALVLDKGAKSHKEYITQTENNLRSTNRLRDANGNFTKEAVALGLAMRGSRGALQDNRDAISGTAAAAIAAGNAMGGTLTPNTYDAGEAADSAATSYLSLFESIFNAKRIASDFANTSGTVTSALAEGVKVGSSSVWKTLAVDYGAVDKATAGATGSVKDNTASLKENRDAFREAFGESAREAIQSTLATLRDGLDQAREKFTSFASTISTGLFGQLNIGSAVDAAAESGGSIVGSFVDQAAGVQAFGDQLQKLLKTNLSEEAFAMVASLSAEKGALLAKELLGANSETMIANFNQAVEATKTVAELVGQNSATKFYQAGVDSALKTYEGFRDNFKKDGPGYEAMQRIMDRLAASMKRDTTVTVTTINRSVNEVLGNFGGPRALGGPVNPSKSYLVGERGPELFVPNIAGTIVPNGGSAGGAAVGGSMITVNVNAGMGTDGAQVGEQIVSALRAYERRNGALPITVAS